MSEQSEQAGPRLVRMHIGQDEHGLGGFLLMGRLVDENNNYFAVEPMAILVRKGDVGQMDAVPPGTTADEALRIISVGRESYLGKTQPMPIDSCRLLEDH